MVGSVVDNNNDISTMFCYILKSNKNHLTIYLIFQCSYIISLLLYTILILILPAL